MPNAFLWGLIGGTRSLTIILWSKVVISIAARDGYRIVLVSVHESPELARKAALDETEQYERIGLTLDVVIGAKGWSGLPLDIANVHHLYMTTQQQETLLVMSQAIAREIIERGEVLNV